MIFATPVRDKAHDRLLQPNAVAPFAAVSAGLCGTLGVACTASRYILPRLGRGPFYSRSRGGESKPVPLPQVAEAEKSISRAEAEQARRLASAVLKQQVRATVVAKRLETMVEEVAATAPAPTPSKHAAAATAPAPGASSTRVATTTVAGSSSSRAAMTTLAGSGAAPSAAGGSGGGPSSGQAAARLVEPQKASVPSVILGAGGSYAVAHAVAASGGVTVGILKQK